MRPGKVSARAHRNRQNGARAVPAPRRRRAPATTGTALRPAAARAPREVQQAPRPATARCPTSSARCLSTPRPARGRHAASQHRLQPERANRPRWAATGQPGQQLGRCQRVAGTQPRQCPGLPGEAAQHQRPTAVYRSPASDSRLTWHRVQKCLVNHQHPARPSQRANRARRVQHRGWIGPGCRSPPVRRRLARRSGPAGVRHPHR